MDNQRIIGGGLIFLKEAQLEFCVLSPSLFAFPISFDQLFRLYDTSIERKFNVDDENAIERAQMWRGHFGRSVLVALCSVAVTFCISDPF